MKVILIKDIETLGRSGEVREVADGYARNYLLPRGLALPATKGNLERFARSRDAAEHRQTRVLREVLELKEKLEALVLEIHTRAGEGGRLFGSVTTQDIADAIAQRGISVSKKQIDLPDPIKTTGFYKIPVRLHPQYTAMVEVNVVGIS